MAERSDVGSILVTGGAGFVGSNLVRRLLEQTRAKVLVLDNFLSSEPWNVPQDARIEVVRGSAADPEVLRRIGRRFDWVFHLATFHGNQNSIARPLDDHDNNLITTLRLCAHLAGDAPPRIVYASAGCSLGEVAAGGAKISREDALLPLYFDSPYQISKIVGELYLNYFERSSGLPSVKARFQNVYGPGEILGAGTWRGTSATVWRNVVPTFVYRALKGLPLRIDEPEATRDFIFVGDIVEGLVLAAERGETGGTYNLGSGHETSILDLARSIRGLADSSSEIVVGARREWDHSLRRAASTARSEAALGFRTRVPLEEGLRTTIEWTRAHMHAIDDAIDRHRSHLPELAPA